MGWLNNPWVVGIGGGILSGVVVTLISRHFFSKRDNREYIQKVIAVNREVTYAIRPGISEGIIPSKEVVQSLMRSTARKYGVESNDVYGVAEIAEDLIKEVMDSSFISASAKWEYCNKLNELKKPDQSSAVTQTLRRVEEMREITSTHYRQRLTTMASVMMGLVTAVMTLVFAFLRFGDTVLPFRVEILLPTLITIGTLAITMSVYFVYREALSRREGRESKESKEKRTEDTSKRE